MPGKERREEAEVLHGYSGKRITHIIKQYE